MQVYPRDFDWVAERKPCRLSLYETAPPKIGFYDLGWYEGSKFEAMYCGRAKGVTLRARLGQHFRHSHNQMIREMSSALYFRCKAFETEELAAYVEAVSIAAFQYPWNLRNEWKQHWALET